MVETVAIALEDVTKPGGMHRNKAMLAKILLIGSLLGCAALAVVNSMQACKTERSQIISVFPQDTLDDLAKKGATNICMLTVAVPSAAAGKINATAPLRMEPCNIGTGVISADFCSNAPAYATRDSNPSCPAPRASDAGGGAPAMYIMYTQWSE